MKRLMLFSMLILLLSACSKDTMRYPDGYDRIYYTMFDYTYDDLGNPLLSNLSFDMDKMNQDPKEFGIKFMSSFVRDYDVEVRLYVRNSDWFLGKINAKKTPGMFSTKDSLAIPGVDFAILDKNMEALTPVRTDSLVYYSIVIPQARKTTETLYIKSLGNRDWSCPRYAWLSLALLVPSNATEEDLQTTMLNNESADYRVNVYSKSWLRSIVLK